MATDQDWFREMVSRPYTILVISIKKISNTVQTSNIKHLLLRRRFHNFHIVPGTHDHRAAVVTMQQHFQMNQIRRDLNF